MLELFVLLIATDIEKMDIGMRYAMYYSGVDKATALAKSDKSFN